VHIRELVNFGQFQYFGSWFATWLSALLSHGGRNSTPHFEVLGDFIDRS